MTTMHRIGLAPALTLTLLAACGDDGRGASAGETLGTAGSGASGATASGGASGSTAGTASATGSETSSSGGTSTSGASTGATSGPPLFDVGMATTGAGTGGPPDLCKVGNEGNGAGPCRTKAPPDAFSPVPQWSWAGDGDMRHSIVAPMVANLTDDNDDGAIDLCDVPDVVVVVNTGICASADIYVLDGATGAVHFKIPGPFARAATPAIGDIDDDGLPEIVMQSGAGSCSGNTVSAFEHDGTLKWVANANVPNQEHAIALADLDTDGDVEIMIDRIVLDHLGNVLFTAPDTSSINWTTTTAADLDGDGDLEVVVGRSAWQHDGSQYYYNNSAKPGQPTIADLDGDMLPEVLVIENQGFTVYENDGTVKVPSQNPTGDTDWRRPAAVHDLDGDDMPEFAVSSRNNYSSFNGDTSKNWSASVLDSSGLASGTAFDFLGDGIAEALYADENTLWGFDGQTGNAVFQVPRRSITIVEYPVVVDVDNDGSAEIVVVSNNQAAGDPTVRVYRDAEDRWIQARRIWNQHTYHVTNVREDGTIPQFEKKHWLQLNTFRTNAQIEGGVVCDPEG